MDILFLCAFLREQLFFIAFGRIWARAMKPAAAVSGISRFMGLVRRDCFGRFNASALIRIRLVDIELMEQYPIFQSLLEHSIVLKVQNSTLLGRNNAFFGDR